MSYSKEFIFDRLTHLGDIPVGQFLEQYWQKKPLLVRNAFPNFESLISADEIAGLSLEEDVVSRLVVEHDKQWTLQHGPIPETTYSELPESNWTLLVQHADSLDPRLNGLLNAFRFIPNWRLDDIMVSYAADQGGVGPHFDYFDVFLLQAEGQRHWKVGQPCTHASPLLPDQPMKILRDFHTREEWLVNPGDLLYIPAKMAHWGEARGECITYSVGFRAPSHAEFMLDYAQEIAWSLAEDNRFEDDSLRSQHHPGELQHTVIEQFRQIFHALGEDNPMLCKWIGEYSTQLKQPLESFDAPLSLSELNRSDKAYLNRCSRVAFYSRDEQNAWLFVNGQTWECSKKLAIMLSEFSAVDYNTFNAQDKTILSELTELGLMTTD